MGIYVPHCCFSCRKSSARQINTRPVISTVSSVLISPNFGKLEVWAVSLYDSSTPFVKGLTSTDHPPFPRHFLS